MTRTGGGAVTAAHVAVAIVSAARVTGVDPARVFEPGGRNTRTRMLAGAGLCARLGPSKTAVAKLVKVPAPTLSPSLLRRENITTDQLLEVAEALEAAGLTAGDDPHARFMAPWGPTPSQPAAAAANAPARKAARAAAKAEPPAPAAAPVRTARAGRGRKPKAAATAEAAPEGTPRAPRRRPASTLQAIPGLKAVSDDIARWAGYFLEAGWRLPVVADLFDVCPVSLLDALDPVEAVRA